MFLQYIAKRLIATVPVLWAVTTIVFFLIHAIPGNPVDIIVGEQALAADKERLTRDLNLDEPIAIQYARYLKGVATLDFGKSIYDKRPVIDHIAQRFGATLMLAFCGMTAAILIAIPFGVLAALKRGTMIDQCAMFASLIGISVPVFWLGPVLVLIFSVELGWLPISGRESFGSLILPSITLGMALAAMLSRLTRASMIEEIKREYVTTARSKGLSERVVIFKHALRNAMNPVITIIGLQFGALLAGTIITEKIFNWPGLGSLLLDSIGRRDYPMVQGCILVISFIYVLVNTATDCMYRLIDPRVKL